MSAHLQLQRSIHTLSRADLLVGESWYHDLRHRLRRMGRAFGFDDTYRKRECCAFAALSPRVSHARNLALFGEFLRLKATGGEVLGLPCLKRNSTVAKRAWSDPSKLTGPKVCAFAEAVHSGGLRGEPVLDVWALRACGVKSPSSRAQVEEASRAYKDSAAIFGRRVHELQAAVWVSIRGSAC